MARTRRAVVVPEVSPSRPPTAEIQVRRDRIIVTAPLHELDVDEPHIVVTPNTVRIGSAYDPRKPEYVILLPDSVNPHAYRSRVHNGVLDIVVMRWKA